MIYTVLDTGNFFVIPGSPIEVWTAEKYKLSHSRERLRAQYRLQPDDSVIAVVGSPFLYHGLWREHALVMRALARAVSKVCDVSTKGGRRIQLLIIGHGNQSSSYGAALQVTDGNRVLSASSICPINRAFSGMISVHLGLIIWQHFWVGKCAEMSIPLVLA
jgi:hypothetical protein